MKIVNNGNPGSECASGDEGNVFLLFFTAQNTVISLNFLVWKFCGNTKFPHTFRLIVQNYAETLPFHKISAPGNYVKLWYFAQSSPSAYPE